MGITAKRQERGYVLLTITAVSIVLIAFMGLVVDVGTMRYWKRRAQNAADMAAIGGVSEVNSNGGSADSTSAGKRASQTNGMTDGENGVAVTVNRPPAGGRFSGKSRYVEAYVSKQVPLSFMSILNFTIGTVRARSVAGPRTSDACIIALAPPGDGTFSAGGSSTFVSRCGIAVNSTGANAIQVGGSTCVQASSIYVVGGSNLPGSPTGCPLSPVVKTHIVPFEDPFANLPAPSYGSGCDVTYYKQANGTATLNPGVYCGGMDIHGTVTLNPGTYILKGGGIALASHAVLNGIGVTIYLTGGGGYAYSPIKFVGNATVRLSAPTSGDYEGILFYGDRTIPGGTHFISGDSSSYFQGTLYFPTGAATLTGNSGLEAYIVLIANTINATGNATFNNNYSSLENGSPLKISGAITME